MPEIVKTTSCTKTKKLKLLVSKEEKNSSPRNQCFLIKKNIYSQHNNV